RTHRRVGRPTTTQDSLPAAGQLCRVGLVTHRVPTKGFRCFLHPSSFPRLRLAQHSPLLGGRGYTPFPIGGVSLTGNVGWRTQAANRRRRRPLWVRLALSI